MKCPRCGSEMVEGHLYCDVCGMEIRMVPDFEPEIENSITEILSTVAEEIVGSKLFKGSSRKKAVKADGTQDQPEKNGAGTPLREDAGRYRLILRLLSYAAVIISAIYIAVYMYHRYSAAYQIEQAQSCAREQNYETAIDYLERARMLSADETEVLLLEAEYCYQAGRTDEAVEFWLTLTGKEHIEYEDKERAYEGIIEIYDQEARYEEINSLLTDCGDENIIRHFQQYMAMAPEFGYESGDYDEVITLKLSANTTGTIYYTLDGSDPDEKSPVYRAPLFLESGEYQVAAVFVNDYGIRSRTVVKWYEINLTAPEPPEVLPASGDYHVPVRIETAAQDGTTVYYTTDGSAPGQDSLKYSEPVMMPLGRSNFKFVTVSEEGVSSEVVSRSYGLSLDTEVTVTGAISNVTEALLRRGVLSDLQGHSPGMVGKYVFKYNTIVEIPDSGYYYVLEEYVEDPGGVQTRTELLYAVEVYTGAPNRLIYDEQGQMGLISLQ